MNGLRYINRSFPVNRPSIRTIVTARAVIYSDHGEPMDTIKVHKYQLNDPEESQILIQTLGAPINPSDLNQIEGVYPSKPEKTTVLGTEVPSAVCGNEGAFKVIGVGSKVTSLAVGDWCIPKLPNFGTWRTHALTEEDNLIKISNKLNNVQAATISVNPPTAYSMLTEYVKLQPGDWFIQNGGNSAVGKYAIQIGKKLGYQSISVVRDREELAPLVEELTNLGATHVITDVENQSREFGSTFKEWTKGKPVKLALNCVGGKSATGIARKLGKDGFLVTYGGMSKQPVTLPTSLHIFKNITSAGFWLTARTDSDPVKKAEVVQKIAEMYENGELKEAPVQSKVFDIEQGSDQELLETFKNAINDSKTAKQLVEFV